VAGSEVANSVVSAIVINAGPFLVADRFLLCSLAIGHWINVLSFTSLS